MTLEYLMRGPDDRLSKGDSSECHLDDREHCKAYMAGQSLLGSLIQEFDDASTVLNNTLLSSITVRCACVLVCESEDELVDQNELTDVKATQDAYFTRICQRLSYRLESFFSKRIWERDHPALQLVEIDNSLPLPARRHGDVLGPALWTQPSNSAHPGQTMTANSGVELPQQSPNAVTSSAMHGTGDESQESVTPPLSIIPDGNSNQHLALSSDNIVQWMRECSPSASEVCAVTSTESNSTTTSSMQASPSALSLAGSYKSQGTRERAQMLLDKSTNAIASLQHAMETSEFVMLVQLAGASGVCRTVVKSLASLAKKIPRTKLSIQVVCMPGLHGVSRMLSGVAVLPNLVCNRRTCPWSTLFKSSKVPRASVFSSATGEVVCQDAVRELQRPDAAESFPWSRRPWADVLNGAILKHGSKQYNGTMSEEALASKSVLLINLKMKADLPAEFADHLAMWIAMYVPAGTVCCYMKADGPQLGKCSRLLCVPDVELAAAHQACEGDNCCMLFSPVFRHLLMAVDLHTLSTTVPAWRVPDNTIRNLVHDLGTFEFKRLHATHTVVMLSLDIEQDGQLRSLFTEAVSAFYSGRAANPSGCWSQHIEPAMYCFASYHSKATPAVVKDFLTDAVVQSIAPYGTCALATISIPNMSVSRITCQQIPDLEYVLGMLDAHFSGDLTVHSLRTRSTLM